ncbi:MAG: hypothetical protein AVDCRST_MAG58-531 [uncultured Rubrobacteraceae bacterium]|uniref:Uncharacterized protein n=1 Tax=uncultured Rubrobacteraceae bacterium TaxID=349277 RepID=A0A6J4QKE6_9ACTN|nr:MAG: hypothetical protein AVDCRST_MAG58-531 [uncultured Rubrobacteraceae bacterium]
MGLQGGRAVSNNNLVTIAVVVIIVLVILALLGIIPGL